MAYECSDHDLTFTEREDLMEHLRTVDHEIVGICPCRCGEPANVSYTGKLDGGTQNTLGLCENCMAAEATKAGYVKAPPAEEEETEEGDD